MEHVGVAAQDFGPGGTRLSCRHATWEPAPREMAARS